ncbi:hypothetical protein Tsubulata_010366, partial [Turnera subulata]
LNVSSHTHHHPGLETQSTREPKLCFEFCLEGDISDAQLCRNKKGQQSGFDHSPFRSPAPIRWLPRSSYFAIREICSNG